MRFDQAAVGVVRGAAHLFSSFEDGGEMWTGQGPRVIRHKVRFSEQFSYTPVIHVSMNMCDFACETNHRADLSADRVTPEGFELVFRTWGDTRVARVRAEWLAIGPVRHEDEFDL